MGGYVGMRACVYVYVYMYKYMERVVQERAIDILCPTRESYQYSANPLSWGQCVCPKEYHYATILSYCPT